jgi:hypothetical protein
MSSPYGVDWVSRLADYESRGCYWNRTRRKQKLVSTRDGVDRYILRTRTQGSSFLATLGWGTERPFRSWEPSSHRNLPVMGIFQVPGRRNGILTESLPP